MKEPNADKLGAIIQNLSPDEVQEFSRFAQRQKHKKKRLDLQLFKLLNAKKRLSSREIQEKLYPDGGNIAAYHSLRKRLLTQLISYITLRQFESDPEESSVVMGKIALARFFYLRAQPEMAWTTLQKAESLAKDAELYELLDNIYLLLLEVGGNRDDFRLEEVISAYEENRTRANEAARMTMAYSEIQQNLRQARRVGANDDFDKVMARILEKYHLQALIGNSPKYSLKLMHIARAAILVSKEYHRFAPLLEKWYEGLMEKQAFTSRDRPYQLEMLYLMAHAHYRDKKFSKSTEVIRHAFLLLEALPSSFLNRFHTRFTLLKAANLAYSDQNPEAIALLEKLLQASLSPENQLNARFNLSVYHFQNEAYNQALQQVWKVRHTDKWLLERMGIEWVIKKHLAEMLLQIELENPEIALSQLKKFRRNFKAYLHTSQYQNLRNFLELLDDYLQRPDEITSNTFHEKVENRIIFLPYEEEDLQALSFYAWLKAKMTGKKYYDVLMALLEKD